MDACYQKIGKTIRYLIIFVLLIEIFLYNEEETGYSPGPALKSFVRKLNERTSFIMFPEMANGAACLAFSRSRYRKIELALHEILEATIL